MYSSLTPKQTSGTLQTFCSKFQMMVSKTFIWEFSHNTMWPVVNKYKFESSILLQLLFNDKKCQGLLQENQTIIQHCYGAKTATNILCMCLSILPPHHFFPNKVCISTSSQLSTAILQRGKQKKAGTEPSQGAK